MKQTNSKLELRILFLLAIFGLLNLSAQEYFPKNDGVKSTNTNYTAFINAKIFVTPTQIIENGTLLIKDGKVINVGAAMTIPKNALTGYQAILVILFNEFAKSGYRHSIIEFSQHLYRSLLYFSISVIT